MYHGAWLQGYIQTIPTYRVYQLCHTVVQITVFDLLKLMYMYIHLYYYTCAIYGVTIAPTRAAAVWKPSANALTLVGYTSGVYT